MTASVDVEKKTHRRVMLVDTDGNPTNLSLTVSDVEIGAVEMKNATDDTRAKVAAASGAAVTDNALIVADPNLRVEMTGTDTQTGNQRVTMDGTVKTATAAPATTTRVLINAEGGEIRYSIDNSAPSATTGGRIPQDGTLVLRVTATTVIKLLGATGAFANLLFLKRT